MGSLKTEEVAMVKEGQGEGVLEWVLEEEVGLWVATCDVDISVYLRLWRWWTFLIYQGVTMMSAWFWKLHKNFCFKSTFQFSTILSRHTFFTLCLPWEKQCQWLDCKHNVTFLLWKQMCEPWACYLDTVTGCCMGIESYHLYSMLTPIVYILQFYSKLDN